MVLWFLRCLSSVFRRCFAGKRGLAVSVLLFSRPGAGFDFRHIGRRVPVYLRFSGFRVLWSVPNRSGLVWLLLAGVAGHSIFWPVACIRVLGRPGTCLPLWRSRVGVVHPAIIFSGTAPSWSGVGLCLFLGKGRRDRCPSACCETYIKWRGAGLYLLFPAERLPVGLSRGVLILL